MDHLYKELESWAELLKASPSSPNAPVLDIYLDLKSPHAYLAVRPTLEIARDYDVCLNFLPYTLSYTAIGVSESVQDDMQRRPASAAADRKARMYYATAREYARLQDLPLRSPYRLLDSDLAHRFFLYAKRQKLEAQFAMHVYLKGWSTGWREFELESYEALKSALSLCGATLDQLDDYLANEAEGELQKIMARAEDSGVVGVPHYVFFDSRLERELGLFGREHLALIRSKFATAGLAKSADVRAEFSHAWSPYPGNT